MEERTFTQLLAANLTNVISPYRTLNALKYSLTNTMLAISIEFRYKRLITVLMPREREETIISFSVPNNFPPSVTFLIVVTIGGFQF